MNISLIWLKSGFQYIVKATISHICICPGADQSFIRGMVTSVLRTELDIKRTFEATMGTGDVTLDADA